MTNETITLIENIKKLIWENYETRRKFHFKNGNVSLEDKEEKFIINSLEFKLNIKQENDRNDVDKFSLKFSFNITDVNLALYYFQELNKKYGDGRPVYLEVEEENSNRYIKTRGLNHVDSLWPSDDSDGNIKRSFSGNFDNLSYAIKTSGKPILMFSYHTKKFINFEMIIAHYFPGILSISSKRFDTKEGLTEYSKIAISTIEGISIDLTNTAIVAAR